MLTFKQYLIDEQTGIVDAGSSNMQVFRVHIPANVYTGKYYDYQTAPILVYASSPEQAIGIVNSNKQAVIDRISQKKIHGRRLVRKNAANHIFFKSSYFVRPVQGYTVNALDASGKFVTVNGDGDGTWSLA